MGFRLWFNRCTLCRDNGMKMLVFDLTHPDNIYDAVMGENVGTVVSET